MGGAELDQVPQEDASLTERRLADPGVPRVEGVGDIGDLAPAPAHEDFEQDLVAHGLQSHAVDDGAAQEEEAAERIRCWAGRRQRRVRELSRHRGHGEAPGAVEAAQREAVGVAAADDDIGGRAIRRGEH